jgi:outer membrane protein assembly factor BamB
MIFFLETFKFNYFIIFSYLWGSKVQKSIPIVGIILIFILSGTPTILSFDSFRINQIENNNEVDWWPMFCHDSANTGYSKCNISEKNKLLWSVKTDIMSSSCPAVLDKKIYVTTGRFGDGQIHCIDLDTGSFIWNYTVDDSIWGSPVVDENRLYVAPRKGRILCFNSSTGEILWETVIENAAIYEESPALYEGKIYVGCTYIPSVKEYNSGIYCLDSSNGEILWFNATISESYEYSPAVSNGKVYTVGLNNNLCCLNAENGNKIWTLSDFSFYSHPVIINDCIYVRTFQGTVLCIEDGKVLWE